MSGQTQSALSRTPIEVWQSILAEVIFIPYYFDAVCPEDVAFEMWQRSRWNSKAYPESEKERKNLRLVCHSWKEWADIHAFREVDLGKAGATPGTAEKILRARKITISSGGDDAMYYTRPTLWERIVFRLNSRERHKQLELLAVNMHLHPRLQSLMLIYHSYLISWAITFNPTLTFSLLSQITSLQIIALAYQSAEDPTEPITLPNLQVLEFMGRFHEFPFASWRLPALQHLILRAQDWKDKYDGALIWLPTLRSLHGPIRLTWSKFTIEDVPNLEEIAFTSCYDLPGGWLLETIPKNHPLRRIIISCTATAWDTWPVWLRIVRRMLTERPNGLQSVKISSSWSDLPVTANEEVAGLAQQAQQSGLRLEDLKGVLLMEFLKGVNREAAAVA